MVLKTVMASGLTCWLMYFAHDEKKTHKKKHQIVFWVFLEGWMWGVV